MSAPTETDALERIILRLFEIQAVKFGCFKLKSGIESPVYFDLRVVISYPKLMVEVSDFLWQAVQSKSELFQSVCGVPYTALPLATCISAKYDIPMLIRRKEAKDYGTKKIIEGHFKKGENCLVVEDVVTSGSSVLETVQSVTNEGIQVTDAVVLLDREQGGKQRLQKEGITLHSVCSISDVLRVLEKNSKLDSDLVKKVELFIKENNTFTPSTVSPSENIPSANKTKKVSTYTEREKVCSHPVTKKLLKIMETKKTNLALSADLTKCRHLLDLVNIVGPHVCMVKTHIDIMDDFSPQFTTDLMKLAEKHNFLIFEDRKFADIGNTVLHQYTGGMYKISQWAHIINAHALPGDGVIKALHKGGGSQDKGCLLIAEMSSSGTLATGSYTQETIRLAEKNKDFVIGFICQSKLSSDPEFLHMTPGVKLCEGSDDLGQQYLTPRKVICDKLSDIIIVGRGITASDDPLKTCIQYKEAGYSAYMELCSQ